MLNSILVYSISEDPKYLQILTNVHFIWGMANKTIDEPDLTHLNAGILKRW